MNNYSTVGDSYGTNVVTLDKMIGAAAKENMPNLDWGKWKTTESFPIVKIASPNGTKGGVWSGDIAAAYAGGSGKTADDPYLIETPEQLARMVGYDVLTKYTGNIENNSDLINYIENEGQESSLKNNWEIILKWII